MIKLLLSLLFLLATSQLFAQVTLFTETFEPGSAGWTSSGNLTPNEWIIDNCAGNGPSIIGVNSMYISPIGGTLPGCDAGETEEHTYANSPSGNQSTVTHHTVDAFCATSLQFTFDYSMEGVSGLDFAEVVYSTDGGLTWNAVGSELAISATWTTTTVALPASLNGATFELGFRFTYDDANVVGKPLAVDNLSVTGLDIVPPVFSCSSTINLPVDATCTAIVGDYTTSGFTVSDNCSDSLNISIGQSIPVGTALAVAPGGTQIIFMQAEDESGNTTQCSFTLNIIDTTAPTPVCPADTSVFVDNNCIGIVPDYTSFIVNTDNCSSLANITMTQSPAPGTIITGAIVVTPMIMTATDEFGNSNTCQFIMRTLDTIPTVITCPVDTNLSVGNNCEFTLGDYTAGAVLVDNCEQLSNLAVTQSPLPGTVINAHQVITLTVSGGVPAIPQSCTFNGWLIDTVAPAIICPTGTSLYVNFGCTASLPDYTGSAAVTENCGTNVTMTQSPVAGTILSVSPMETITLTATDSSGNTNSCQFFLPVIDTISPIVGCPLDQQVAANATCQGVLGDYTALGVPSDNCSTPANITVTQSPAAGSTFTGSIVVTLTAEDESSNTGTCTFNVTTVDQTPPAIFCPSNQIVPASANCDYLLGDVASTANGTDNCTSFANLSFSQSPIAGTTLPAGINTITITAQDEAGNTQSCDFALTVLDQADPVFTTCPGTQTVIVDAACEGPLADYTSLAVVSDNCTSSALITVTQSPIAGTTISATTVVTLTATDAAGNTNDCSFNVLLSDTTNPVIVCPADQTVAIDPSCSFLVPDFTSSVGGTDNCSVLSNMTITQNPVVGTGANGVTPVIITLTDESGNATTCIASALPDDITAPTITCPTTQTASAGTACDYALTNYGTLVTITDNCGSYTLSQSPPVGTIVPVGTNTITMTVTDPAGNSSTCDFNLFVSETEAPLIDCPNDTVSCDPVVFYSLPTFSDNCLAELVQTDLTGLTVGSTFPVGATDIMYQAIDTSGNVAGCSFRVEILEFPSAAIITLDTIELCATSTALLEADPATSGTGVWTVSSGQGSFNNQFANTTGVNTIPFGESTYTWTISTAACGSTSDSILVIRHQAPFATSIASEIIYACADSVIQLQALAPTVGTGMWTVTPQAIISTPNQNITISSMPNDGWYEYTWTVSNGNCPQTYDSVLVYHAANDLDAITSDSAICLEDGNVQISANSLAPDQFSHWSFISGGGSIDDIYAQQTGVTNLQHGINMIVYEVTNPNCPTLTDTVTIIANICDGFDPVFPTVITPNYDGRNDVFEIDYLELIYPDCYVTIFNRWGSVVYESVGYDDPWDGTFNNEPLPLGTYFYRIELNDADGTVYAGDISIIR